jgi:hypothetical protein
VQIAPPILKDETKNPVTQGGCDKANQLLSLRWPIEIDTPESAPFVKL